MRARGVGGQVKRPHGTTRNSNLTTTTLPHRAPDLTSVPVSQQTTLTYFDTGQIATTNDHVNPVVDYDYNARGQQTYRRAGTADPEYWEFNDDGTLKEHRDRRKDGTGGQRTTYTYNADN